MRMGFPASGMNASMAVGLVAAYSSARRTSSAAVLALSDSWTTANSDAAGKEFEFHSRSGDKTDLCLPPILAIT